MGRTKLTDSRFTFRADSNDITWFQQYCREHHTNVSEYLRQHIRSLREQDGRSEFVNWRQYILDSETLGIWLPGSSPAECSSMRFDGSTVVSLGNRKEFSIRDAITVEAWVCPEQTDGWRLICTQWGGLLTGSYHLACEHGIPTFHIGTEDGLADVGGIHRLETGQWHHVAGTYDRTRLRLYVNGAEAASRNHRARLVETDFGVVIGGKYVGPSDLNWIGMLAEVRISTVARPPEELSPNLTERE